jgi:HAD superfamily hydrolase (TIGR01509 family)
MLKALIWDVDGTIAETERDGHRVAYNRAFEALGLPWHWSVARYTELLRVAGGRERLLHDMASRPDAPAAGASRDALARELHLRKNALYVGIVAQGGLRARPGVLRLVSECQAAGVPMGVATTSSRGNVEALFASLWGPGWQDSFRVLVCAEDTPTKKPDPRVYVLALQGLGVTADAAFALEDSPNGLAAARAAGLRCGITRSIDFADAVFDGAHWVRDDLDAEPAMTLTRLTWAVR